MATNNLKLKEALEEAAISVACLLDGNFEDLTKDLIHIQNQIDIIEDEVNLNAI
tara:strand:- start:23 stop:184 length:162 start_codon:yes stop_codon:yes gene_type:complete